MSIFTVNEVKVYIMQITDLVLRLMVSKLMTLILHSIVEADVRRYKLFIFLISTCKS